MTSGEKEVKKPRGYQAGLVVCVIIIVVLGVGFVSTYQNQLNQINSLKADKTDLQIEVNRLENEIDEKENQIAELQSKIEKLHIMSIGELLSKPAFYHGKQVVVTGKVVNEELTKEGYASLTSRIILSDGDGNNMFVEVFERQTYPPFLSSYKGLNVVVMGIFIYPYTDPQGVYEHSLTAHQVSIMVID